MINFRTTEILVTHLTHSPLERGGGVFFFLFPTMNLGTRSNSLKYDVCD